MKQIIIRRLDDSIIHMLKKIAWMDGRTPDETARMLLIEAIQHRATSPRLALEAKPAA